MRKILTVVLATFLLMVPNANSSVATNNSPTCDYFFGFFQYVFGQYIGTGFDGHVDAVDPTNVQVIIHWQKGGKSGDVYVTPDANGNFSGLISDYPNVGGGDTVQIEIIDGYGTNWYDVSSYMP